MPYQGLVVGVGVERAADDWPTMAGSPLWGFLILLP